MPSVLGQAFIEILPNTAGFASKLEKDVKESVDKASASSGGAFNNLASVGQKALLGLGGAAISGGLLAVKLADSYEASHARLVVAFKNAGSSVDAYSKQISAADKANEKYGLSSDQTEAALARLTQATNDPKKALADLGVAVNLAAARHIDLEAAATIVGKVAQGNTTVLKRYGIDLGLAAGGATQLNKAHDALAKATANLSAVEQKVGLTHGVTAAQASALASAHDAVTKATLSLQNAQAGLAVVEANVSSGKLTGVAASAALEKANNAVAAAAVNLEAKQRNVTDVEKKLGAQHGITASQAAQLQKAHDAVAAATTHVSSVSGAAGQAIDALGQRFAGSAAAQAETFHGKIAALEAQGKDLGIHVGLVLIPIIEKLAGAFVKVLGYLEAHKPILIAVGILIGTVLVASITAYIAKLVIAGAQSAIQFGKMLASAVSWAAAQAASLSETIALMALYVADTVAGAASTAASWVASAATTIASWVAMGASAVANAAVSTAAWLADAAAATAAFIAENAAMLGIGIAIVALVAGIVWLVTHWSQAWAAIKAVASEAWHFLQAVFAPVVSFFAGIFDAVEGVVTGVIDWISSHWELILAILTGPIGLAILFVKDHFHEIADIVSGVVSAVVGYFESLPGRVIGGLERIIGLFRDHIIQPLHDFIYGWGENTVLFFLGLPDRIISALGSLVGKVATFFEGIGKGIVSAIVRGIEAIAGDIGKALTGAVTSAIKSLPGGGVISKGLSAIGLAEGGLVPGPKGAPMLAIVHGGEFMLSNDMLKGITPAAGATPALPPALGGSHVEELLAEIAAYLRSNPPGKVADIYVTPGGSTTATATETVQKLQAAQYRAGR